MNVSAGNAWRSTGQPLFYGGAYFYRSGSTVFFDGHVMRPAGADNGIVFYSDVTQEPYSVIYVPVGGGQMQPYERIRIDDLAGTTGSRTPSYPVDLSIERRDDQDVERTALMLDSTHADRLLRRPSGVRRVERPVQAPAATAAPAPEFKAVGAITIVPASRENAPAMSRKLDSADVRTPPAGTTTVWVEYDQVQWFNAGPAVVLDESRFVRIGELNGFSVYRERGDAVQRIYVSVTLGGLVAPYQRR
ncbi:MAG: hypothetical protein U0Q11_27600 [Vicinamibacterales bacterium]